jgi:hypothetical protein
MGLAMATKIYPVLLAPLLLFGAWIFGKLRKGISSMFAWALGLFGMTFSLLIFGAQSQELMSAIRFHINKPFGIDGTLGSLVPILQNLLDIPLRMAPRNGIHGFDSDLGGLATTAITWGWFPIALGVIALILRKQRIEGYPNAGDLFVLLGVFVGFGKLMAPQYTWWALSLLPFAPANWLSRKQWIAVLVLLVASLLLGQIVYPLNYSEFIESFAVDPMANPLFWINSTKNLMWLAAVGIAASGLFRTGAKS